MYNTAGKHILSPLERCLGYLKTTCKLCEIGIACGYRKYENVFTHEYIFTSGIALGEYDTLG
jgi:hypothetical protein